MDVYCTGAGDGLAFGKTVGRLRYSQRVGFACVGLTPDDGVRPARPGEIKAPEIVTKREKCRCVSDKNLL